jgi:hypothetical protein
VTPYNILHPSSHITTHHLANPMEESSEGESEITDPDRTRKRKGPPTRTPKPKRAKAGRQGKKGAKGDKGANGRNGKDGTRGKDGRNGKDGKDGESLSLEERKRLMEASGSQMNTGTHQIKVPYSLLGLH